MKGIRFPEIRPHASRLQQEAGRQRGEGHVGLFDFDTLLAVYTGSVGSLDLDADNDDALDFASQLTSRLPFSGESVGAQFASILEDAPKRLARPDVPPQLEAIIHKCLRRPVHERWHDVADLAGALAPFASRTGQLANERIQKASVRGRSSPGLERPPPSEARVISKTSEKLSSPDAVRDATLVVDPQGVPAASGPVVRTGEAWTNPAMAPPRPPKTRSVWLILAPAIAVLVACAAMLLIGRPRRHDPTAEPKTSLSSPPPVWSAPGTLATSDTTATAALPIAAPPPSVPIVPKVVTVRPRPQQTVPATDTHKPPPTQPTDRTSAPVPSSIFERN
jgi:serine/threonine-protein kinase